MRRSLETLPKKILCFQNGIRVHGSLVSCNGIDTNEKNTAVPALAFTKMINAHRRYVQVSYIQFHSSQTISVQSSDGKSSLASTARICTKLAIIQRNYAEILCVKFSSTWSRNIYNKIKIYLCPYVNFDCH